MGARGAVFGASDGQGCSFEINLGPLQVTQLRRPEAMPEGEQDHGLVPMRPAMALASVDQPLDLFLGKVFASSDVTVLGSAWGDFPFYSVWGYDFQGWFWHM